MQSQKDFPSLFLKIFHKGTWNEDRHPPILASSNRHNVVWEFFEILTSQNWGGGDDEVATDCTNGRLEEWTEATASGVAKRVKALVGVADNNDSRQNHQGRTHIPTKSRANAVSQDQGIHRVSSAKGGSKRGQICTQTSK